jgi:hypothetical protein
MPFGLGVALGKKLAEKAVDSIGEAAVGAVKVPRTRKRKKSAKARRTPILSWVIGLIGLILVALIFGGHHSR